MWQIEIHTWGRESGGAGQRHLEVHRRRHHVEASRRPRPPDEASTAKSDSAISAANPQRVYASIETGDGAPWHGKPTDNGHLWRSDDAGETWQLMNPDHQIGGRTAYYNRMGVTPDNADEAYFLSRELDEDARRRQDDDRSAARSSRRRRSSRHLVRRHERQSLHREPRRRRLDHEQSRQDLAARRAAHRADVPRHGGRPHSLLALRQQAGWSLGRGPEQREDARPVRRGRRHPAGALAHGGRRRERLGHPRSRRHESRLVERERLRLRGRHRHALPTGPPNSHRRSRGLADGHHRHGRVRREVPLRLDVPAHDLAIRSQPRVRRQSVRARHRPMAAEHGA